MRVTKDTPTFIIHRHTHTVNYTLIHTCSTNLVPGTLTIEQSTRQRRPHHLCPEQSVIAIPEIPNKILLTQRPPIDANPLPHFQEVWGAVQRIRKNRQRGGREHRGGWETPRPKNIPVESCFESMSSKNLLTQCTYWPLHLQQDGREEIHSMEKLEEGTEEREGMQHGGVEEGEEGKGSQKLWRKVTQ